MVRTALMCCVVICVSAVAAQAVLTNTATDFVEDWEHLTVGDSVSLDGWTTTNAATVEAGDIGSGGANIARMITGGGSNVTRNDIQVLPSADGLVKIDFDFRYDFDAGAQNIYFSFAQGDTGAPRILLWLYVSSSYGDRRIRTYNGSSYEIISSLALNENTDYHITIVLDTNAGTFDVSISADGSPHIVVTGKATDAGAGWDSEAAMSYARFGCGGADGANNTFWVDDLRYSPVEAVENSSRTFLEDFENLSVSNSPALNGWSVGNKPVVQAGSFAGGTKVLNVTDGGGGSNIVREDIAVMPDENGDVSYSFDFTYEWDSSTLNIKWTVGQVASGGRVYMWIYQDSANADRRLWNNNGSAYQVVSGYKFSENTVYHVEGVVHTATGLHDVTISTGGEPVVEATDLATGAAGWSGTSAMDYFGMNNGSLDPDVNKLYVDTILIQPTILPPDYPVDCAEALAEGYGLVADLNSDCYVEWADFGVFASQWQQCMDPTDTGCDTPWVP